MKISVVVHTKSKHPRVEKDVSGFLHVYVKAKPVEGNANEAVSRALVSYFSTNVSSVRLIKGRTSKHKTFEILDK